MLESQLGSPYLGKLPDPFSTLGLESGLGFRGMPKYVPLYTFIHRVRILMGCTG